MSIRPFTPIRFTLAAGLALAALSPATAALDGTTLRNPIYVREGWSVKDACMAYHDGRYYLFFSAFFWEDGRERSHVVGVRTADFIHYSEPLFIWRGREGDWIGMCSPNITRVGDTWYLVYNSWGGKRDQPNQLFYARSNDLEHWEHDIPLARNLTAGKDIIDGAVACHDGRFYLIYHEWRINRERVKLNRIAVADSMDGEFRFIGDGYVRFLMPDGNENGLKHENFEFIRIEDVWLLLSTDYRPHNPYLYRISGSPDDEASWQTWTEGRKLIVPEEHFNTRHRANSAFMADWREHDGYVYLLYAGHIEDESHAGRGNNTLGLARSQDLVDWQVPPAGKQPFIDWTALNNPVYAREHWSIKDACMVYRAGRFHVFFSAFYEDRGRLRSHVASVVTEDFKDFSEPALLWDGAAEGWIGMCSPNITRVGETYYLTYNSWGDMEGRPNQLFYAVSRDLEHWDHGRPLAPEVTVKDGAPARAIDAAVAHYDNNFWLIWKEGDPHITRMAHAPGMDGPWRYVGEGYPRLALSDGADSGMVHENYHFMHVNGYWRLVTTDYAPHQMYLYTMLKQDPESARDWLAWRDGFALEVPRQGFNTDHRNNAGFIADWRIHDGHYYMIYAGRTHDDSHDGRGDNRLGLARSTDLRTWTVPGQ